VRCHRHAYGHGACPVGPRLLDWTYTLLPLELDVWNAVAQHDAEAQFGGHSTLYNGTNILVFPEREVTSSIRSPA
jgi:hypothetical protein